MEQEYIRLKDISKKMALSTKTLRRYIKQGKLFAIKTGNVYKIPISELNRFTLSLFAESYNMSYDDLDKLLKQRNKENIEKRINFATKFLNLNKEQSKLINEFYSLSL